MMNFRHNFTLNIQWRSQGLGFGGGGGGGGGGVGGGENTHMVFWKGRRHGFSRESGSKAPLVNFLFLGSLKHLFPHSEPSF